MDCKLCKEEMKRRKERRAIEILQQIIDMDKDDGDALPGSVVKLVKDAQTIMKKRNFGPKRVQ